MEELKIKVCGLKYCHNIRDLVNKIKPDYIGFIFYPLSSRFAPGHLRPDRIRFITDEVKKTGVFVNENKERIMHYAYEYQLNAIQLHGNEPPELCEYLKKQGLEVIKSFAYKGISTLKQTDNYTEVADYFLFDSPGPLYGGNGSKFNWDELKYNTPSKPYFLSGGIDLGDAYRIQKLPMPEIYGVDINSRFEISPGEKNIDKIMEFSNILFSKL